jgi:small conductance mechanosensitive channel
MELTVNQILEIVPTGIAMLGVILTLTVANYVVRRGQHGELSVSRQLLMLALTSASVLVIIFALPLSDASRGQLLGLIGIVVTAVIALSSTTFVGNIMAGLMLRAVKSFRPGDFIRSGDCFGKVTERGIFHTEIQTEDRDLTTLPNLFLVNNPVTVVHDSGTIISATLSLGYDVSHVRVEELLKRAADETGLEDAFVLVGELGDFSVSYRVGGFSSDVSHLLTSKSSLRKNILKVLHENGVEIVSPHFMNQRLLATGERVIPGRYRENHSNESESSPEEVIFEKADSAAEREALKIQITQLREQQTALHETRKASKGEDTASLDARRDAIGQEIEEIEQQLDDD